MTYDPSHWKLISFREASKYVDDAYWAKVGRRRKSTKIFAELKQEFTSRTSFSSNDMVEDLKTLTAGNAFIQFLLFLQILCLKVCKN